MALRTPLVLINGEVSTLPAADTISTGASEDVGIPYRLTKQVKVVPIDFQYLISGRLILAGSSILRVAGQVVVL